MSINRVVDDHEVCAVEVKALQDESDYYFIAWKRSEQERDFLLAGQVGLLRLIVQRDRLISAKQASLEISETARDALRDWKANAQITLEHDKVQLDALADVIEATKAATKRGNLMTPTWVLDALNGTTK